LVEPHYPKAGNGRQPVGLAIMLRIYFLQQWFNLSDPGMEEAFYESPVLRRRTRPPSFASTTCSKGTIYAVRCWTPRTAPRPAGLRIYQGALPRHMEEPPVAVCGLRAGEPLPTSQSAGPSKGVVSPEARKRPHATRKARSTPFRQKTDPQSGNHPKPRRRRKITPLRKGSLAAYHRSSQFT
jgi:hypothetical protein